MKSIAAGIMIGIGAAVNCAVGGGVLGAVIFSIGLIAVLTQELNLFTGKAGLVASSQIPVWHLPIIWFGNFIGIMFTGMLTIEREEIRQLCASIYEARLAQGLEENFLRAIFCGILMYIAVSGYQKTKSFVPVIFGVSAFILGGFNHCIADMYYIMCASVKGFQWVLILLVETLGNFVGCNIIPFLLRVQEYD